MFGLFWCSLTLLVTKAFMIIAIWASGWYGDTGKRYKLVSEIQDVENILHSLYHVHIVHHTYIALRYEKYRLKMYDMKLIRKT